MKVEKIEYYDDEVLLEGHSVHDDKVAGKKPIILIVHDWSGKNDFACQKAEKLAELGYVGFAVDMFGKGINGKTTEEKTALIQPFMQDRAKLQKRILAAFETAKKLAHVESNQIAVIGFCFGGLCALDLARTGVDIKAAVSFHGLLNPPPTTNQIKAKVLVLHGFDDPMVPPETTISFCKEMTHAKANWELNVYGNTKHSFTNPQSHDINLGLIYDKQADTRSWIAMKEFFKEIFGK